jgi:hypothetical protein|nr:MAG TPA: hypothetical protein [Caudoviricetes sp.]
MKLGELETIQDIVKDILENEPQSRESDNILCYFVYKKIGKEKGVDIDKMTLPTFLFNMSRYKLPTIESIGRTRRKIVEQHPELSSSKKIKDARRTNEDTFRRYAAIGSKG